jgi:hypothetical protein
MRQISKIDFTEGRFHTESLSGKVNHRLDNKSSHSCIITAVGVINQPRNGFSGRNIPIQMILSAFVDRKMGSQLEHFIREGIENGF